MIKRYPFMALAIPCFVLLMVPVIFNPPYGFYGFLRLATCIGAAVMAWAVFSSEIRVDSLRYPVAVLLAGIAVLFNPIQPVHLDRETWRVIDALTAAAFVAGGIVARRE